MKKIKNTMLGVLVFVMSVMTTIPVVAHAEETNGYRKVHNKAFAVDVSIKDGIKLSDDSITEFLASVDPANRKNIQIEYVGEMNTVNQSDYKNAVATYRTHKMSRSSRLYYSKHVENKWHVNHKKFLISVAKGMNGKLSSDVSFSENVDLSGSVSAPILDFVKAEISASFGLSFLETVRTSHEFLGSPESSPYNSRTYYAGIVNEIGYYKVWRWRNHKDTVRFTIPKQMIIYSTDIKVD